MAQNIIFDMGGVLLDFSEARLMDYYFGQFSEDARAQIRGALFASGLWRRMDRGDFDEAGMARAVCELLPEAYHAAVTRLLFHSFEAMPPLPTNELIPLLKARGQRVYLLTNAPRAFHREKYRLPYLALFDGVLASCDVGLLKPDPEIYRLFLRTFGLRAEDCLFIDDMRANIEGARRVGIPGHCFQDRDLEALEKALAVASGRAV
ncbi:MAG: HAD family phosphatase [Oscillospiraceae bacterium]|jgi:putative hydrolase of the HAD superfamily|nr:HAD family phosphatase [Oscillospiraceae bacterium]